MNARIKYSSMLALLRARTDAAPDYPTFTFLEGGENNESALSNQRLFLRARAIAAGLQARAPAGARVLILFPPGLDYVTALYGCFLSGHCAVPAYPPYPSRLERTLPRLQAIIDDSGSSIVLTSSSIKQMAALLFQQAPDLARLHWLSTEDLPDSEADAWHDPQPTVESLALLQYTSGSTAMPKGVMVSHGNLLHNAGLIQQCFGKSATSRGVLWLPPYHDMGLVGGLISPLFCEGSVVLMSPLAFLQRPVRWLKAISRYRASTSGGPNFAYDLCLRKITDAELGELDLSCWELAFNGAEPVRADTIRRFNARFAAAGFRSSAMYPCYGLAEVTLLASGKPTGEAAVMKRFSPKALDAHHAVPNQSNDSRELVSCGKAAPGLEIAIVDPDQLARTVDGVVGEIWIRGASVAGGYWQKPDASLATFGAKLADGSGPFLRTGDLGFFLDGELFVTGRVKDLIIIRGRNLYPQDIESVAVSAHQMLRSGCTAAFSVEVDGDERLVVVQEVDKKAGATDVADAKFALQRLILESAEVNAHEVVLVASGTILKTSSGKIQRQATKEAYLRGSLDTL